MGSKNSKPTTTTTSPNPEAAAAYSALLGRASGVASAPYTPYTGELVAPVNAQQNLGISGINQNAGFALPYIQQAAGLAGTAAQPLSAADINSYLSPYIQGVVAPTQAEFANMNAQQLQQVKGNAIAQGALGGNREAIAEAETTHQQQLAQAPVIAGLYNSGYQNAAQTALAAKNATQSGANLLGNLGVVGQNSGLTGAQAQVGAGTLQQQTQQQLDAAQYQQFLNQLAYPFQTTQWLAGIDTGVGSQMGGTSQTYAPAPSMLSQIGGGLTSGVGLLGASGAFGAAGWLAPAMAALAGGGAAPSHGVARPSTIAESDETLRHQQKQLVDGHRRVHMFPAGTQELDVPHGMARTERNGDVFHFDPQRIGEDDIHHLSDSGRENEMLDLGPYSKHDVIQRMMGGEIPIAVVERHPDGHEVRAAAGTHTTAHHQLAAMHRTKSPGNRVGLEDPRETLGARLRGAGGRAQGFAEGGAPQQPNPGDGVVIPYAGAHRWIPMAPLAPGRTAPQGHQTEGVVPSLAEQAKQIGELTRMIQGETAKPRGDGVVAPLAAGGDETQDRSGGGVVHHYAEGGTPYSGGGPGWIPAVQLTHGNTMPKPPQAPKPTSTMMSPDAMKNFGALGKMVGSGIANRDADPGSAEEPLAGLSADDYEMKNGGVVRGYADGGSPYDENYFDETFYNPILHDAQSREILMDPVAKKDYTNRIIADSDFGNSGFAPQRVADVPMPRPRPAAAGVVPRFDLPPEILTGSSEPVKPRNVSTTSFARAPEGSGSDYVPVVSGDRSSPLDDAAWPYGPRGAPAAARDPRSGVANIQEDDVSPVAARSYAPTRSAASPIPAPRDAAVAAAAEPAAPAQGVAPKKGINWGSDSNLWPALIMAGAHMMSSKSPYPGVAIGEGLAGGASTYQTLRMNDQKVEHEAKKLEQEATLARERMKIQTMPYTEMTAFQRASLDETLKENERKFNQLSADQRARLAEQMRAHNLTLRTPIKRVDEKGAEHLYFPTPSPDGTSIEWGELDTKTNQIIPLGKSLPGAPAPGQQLPPSSSLPSPGGAAQPPARVQNAAFNPGEGMYLVNAQQVDASKKEGGYDYTASGPYIEKGWQVPEPQETAGHSPASLKIDAEMYLQTGKLPPTRSGRSPIAIAQQNYRNAVQNYGSALGESRGLTPAQTAEMWRTAPGMLRFILGADGRATVSLGTAVRHLDTLADYAKAWNAGDQQTLNRIGATLSREFGGTAVTNLESVARIVGPEILKAIGVAGAGTQEGRNDITNQFTSSRSYDQVMGAVVATQKLMSGQLEGKERQARNAGVSPERFRDLIGDRPYEILSTVDKGGKNPLTKPTFEQFVAAAKKGNSKMSDDELRTYYKKKYE